jgi:hypothetical protein
VDTLIKRNRGLIFIEGDHNEWKEKKDLY